MGYFCTKTTALEVAMVAMEKCIMPYDIPKTILTDSGPHFVSKFLAALCSSVETKLARTTEYHPHANVQLERFSTALVARLRHYIGEHQLTEKTTCHR